jgi:hypothetical protein
MKRIGIEVNGVLRDTIGKLTQLYEKHLVENYQDEFPSQTYTITDEGDMELNTPPEPFEYKIISPVTSLKLRDHFSFQNDEELFSFMYEDYTMELFGHAPSTEISTFNDLNELYLDLRDKFNLSIVSDEIGKSKPATLFFLSKFGCLLEKIKFYSNITINDMWDDIDILITSNPNLLLNHPQDKMVIKFETIYNQDIIVENSIKTIKELWDKLKNI